MRIPWLRSGLLFGSLFLLAARCAIALSDELPSGFPNFQLAERYNGDAAISALGNDLPAVAAFYRKSAAELQGLLRGDHSLWVDHRGRLFFVCNWGTPPGEESPPADNSPPFAGPFTYADTFRLHSRLGATRLIYLDFDGHDASGTSWGADAIGRPFDLDSDPSTFSTTERDRILYIWQRVAEDFALYEIDVTTEDPGVEALRKSGVGDLSYGIRVVIGGSSGDWYGSAGGVAYVGSFDWNTDTPCWVWPGSLSNSEKNIAEAASHEAGHTLGLSHDGKTDGTTYYSGHGNWAPIMGVGYSRPIVQWSKGEYSLANNTQDDLAVMPGEGVSYRADDHGNSIAAATALSGVSFSTYGNIERTTDTDFFSIQTGAGQVRITATPAPRGPNLHILLSLYDSAGAPVSSANSTDNSSGVQAVTLTAVLPIGTYYFSVDGAGTGNPLNTGYSEYASLGEYRLTGALPSDSAWIQPAEGTNHVWTDAVNWAAGAIPLGRDGIARLTNDIAGDQTIHLDMPVTLGRLFLGDADGSHSFVIENGAGGSLRFNAAAGGALLSKSAGSNDTIAANIFLQSDLTISNDTSQDLILSGAVSGSGGLVSAGPGRLTLAGTNEYSGSTVVAGGTLVVATAAALAGSAGIDLRAGSWLDAAAAGGVALATNQTLTGAGAVLGGVMVPAGAQLAPGSNGVAGTLSFSNHLALGDGAKLLLDVANSPDAGGGTNDLITVAGDLSLTGAVSVAFNFLQGFQVSPATYTLIVYSGTLTGGASNLVALNATNRFAYAFDDSAPGEIRVQIFGSPSNLVWQGGSGNRWDVDATANWVAGGISATFLQLDSVLFDDSGSVMPAVNLIGALKPAFVTNDSAQSYTFSGSGGISGSATVVKQGPGTLNFNTTNDYTGATFVNGGTLKAGNPAALGATIGGTIIGTNATLDLNAMSLGAEAITVQGQGSTGAGAIINGSASAQTNALRFVALAGDVTLGGVGRWDIRANPAATIAGNNFNLTKTGANEIWLADVGASGLGDINVNQGTLGVQGSTTLGDAAKTLSASNANVSIRNTENNVLNKKLVLDAGGLHSLAGDNAFAGTISLNGSNLFTASAIFALQGAISGEGSLTKLGSGILALSGANSYTGATLIAAGTLMARNGSALGSAVGGTTIATGARLDVNGQNLGGEPVVARGTGLGNAGAIINNGASQQFALRFVTLSNHTTFGGIGRWDLRANPTGSLVANNFNLTKTGPNEVWLANLGTNTLGTITVSEGLLGVLGTTTLGNAGSSMTIASAGSLGISGTGANTLAKATSMSGGRIYNSSGNNTFAGAISLSGSNRLDVASGSTLELGGALTGSGSLNKLNPGTVVFTANNTYSGYTLISAGALQVGNGGAAGSPGTGSITNNGTLVFNRSNAASWLNLITGPGALVKNGAGLLTLSGNNSYSGGTTLNAGGLALNSDVVLGSGTLTFNSVSPAFVLLRPASASPRTLANSLNFASGPVVFGEPGTGDLVFNGAGVNCGSAPRTLVISNVMVTINSPITNASGGLIKDGPGMLILAGNNSHAGGMTVLLGTLRLDDEGRLGNNPAAPFKPGQFTLDGGALQTTATFAIDDSNRGITLGSAGGTFNVNPATTLTVANTIAGTGSFVKTGGGMLYLSGLNSYAGDTIISSGVLSVNGSRAIPNGAGKGNVVVNGTLELNGTTVVVNGLSGAGIVDNSSGAPATLMAGANDATSTFGGVIRNSGAPASLVKTSLGVLTLSNTNSYTGGTTISGGTLALNASGAMPASPIIQVDAGAALDVTAVAGGFVLNAGQTMTGNGNVAGDVIANGTVAPGASVGQLAFSQALTLAGTTALEIAKSGTTLTNDVVAVGGVLTYGGVLSVTHAGDALAAGDSFQLFSAADHAGTFAVTNLPALDTGLRWTTTQLATNGTIEVVSLTPPEILPLTMDGTNLLISIQSEAGVTYVLQSTEDLNPPVLWSGIATNLGTGALLTFSVPVDALMPQRFFRLEAY